MKSKLFIGGIVVFIIACIFIIINSIRPIEFKNNEIPRGGNIINNNTGKTYYDTILLYSLDYLNIKNKTIEINNMDLTSMKGDNSIRGAVGIHPNSDKIFLFLNNLNKEEALTYIPHEAIHINQYSTGELINVNGNEVIYLSKRYRLDLVEYNDRPWEIYAFNNSGEITKHLKRTIVK